MMMGTVDVATNTYLVGAERERFVSYVNAIRGAYENSPTEGPVVAGYIMASARDYSWTYPAPVVDMLRSACNRAHKDMMKKYGL